MLNDITAYVYCRGCLISCAQQEQRGTLVQMKKKTGEFSARKKKEHQSPEQSQGRKRQSTWLSIIQGPVHS